MILLLDHLWKPLEPDQKGAKSRLDKQELA